MNGPWVVPIGKNCNTKTHTVCQGVCFRIMKLLQSKFADGTGTLGIPDLTGRELKA